MIAGDDNSDLTMVGGLAGCLINSEDVYQARYRLAYLGDFGVTSNHPRPLTQDRQG